MTSEPYGFSSCPNGHFTFRGSEANGLSDSGQNRATAEFWPALPASLAAVIAGKEHLLVECSQILVEFEDSWEGHSSRYGFKDPAGSQIGAGDAIVWSDFQMGENGINRILLVNISLNSYRLGRMVHRLLEIETYRMMASLTLPVAKEVTASLKGFERELTQLSDQNANSSSTDARQILRSISDLSARIVRLTARSRQRFSAAEAYAQIVFERITELRESHVGGQQRLGVFERRFKPTVRYCAATQQRVERLNDSVANLGELLRDPRKDQGPHIATHRRDPIKVNLWSR